MITQKDIKKTSELARIELDSREEKKLASDLEKVLGYIEKLKEINVAGVDKAGHIAHFNEFREDHPPKEIFNPEPLMEAAPDAEKGFIKVKKVLEK